MKLITACLKIRHLCRQLETETDEAKRRILARLASDYCRRLERSVGDEEELHHLAFIEFGHRLKNKIATIQSIIAYQLRGNKAARDSILQRLGALSSADLLIETAQGRGALIGDIINTELGPYEISRATIEGPQIFVPAKLALVLALIVHELATNATKYGALSCPTGRVSCLWSMAGSKLLLEWRESGGPAVAIPTHEGFGTRLFSRALGQFGGTIAVIYAPTGLICTMSLAFPSINARPALSQRQAPPLGSFSTASNLPSEPSSFACPATGLQTAGI
ncbi:MAG TPA: sensor histidine kinase [Pseudolabrys sp.]|nr:sensor histidine kinase [Pseudolabrys sp.]